MTEPVKQPSRRRLLVAGLGLPLAGCGFRPLYAPIGDGPEAVDLREELAAVRVANIPDRNGQLLRRLLERRLEGSRPGTPARYGLTVALAAGAEALGYRRDGTVTRVRYTFTGNFTLATLAAPPVTLATGQARTIDAYNVPDLQFFSADSSRDAMERRLVEVVGDEIYRRVAVELRRRREAGPA